MTNLFSQEPWARRGENDARLFTAELELSLINTDAWASYTPVLTNITLGNGTLVGRYAKLGRTVHVLIWVTCGTTTVVNAFVRFALPFNNAQPAVGSYYASDSSAGTHFVGIVLAGSGANDIVPISALGNHVGGLQPFGVAWANGDGLIMSITYESST